MWTEVNGLPYSREGLAPLVNDMDFSRWKPNGVVIHNTYLPSLAQWKGPPGAKQRIANLVHYFRDVRGWPSGPHAFVDDEVVWAFTPFNQKGTHSPSWNGSKIGIEMVADFSKEDPTSGPGLAVVENTAALTALLCAKLGLDPQKDILLHKMDPRTTHDCPGKLFRLSPFIDLVEDFLTTGGEHDLKDPEGTQPQMPILGQVMVEYNDTLNIREAASAGSRIVGELANGERISVLGHAKNGSTVWLRIDRGWVSAKYVKEG